jgi:hypothetical protein
MHVISFLHAARTISQTRFYERYERWVKLSHRAGGIKPRSDLSGSFQDCGRLDLLLCQAEMEYSDIVFRNQNIILNFDDVRNHATSILHEYSSFWISSAYEAFRSYKEESESSGGGLNEMQASVYREMSLVRMPLFKHEYAGMTKPKPDQKKNIHEILLSPDGEKIERYHGSNRSSALIRSGCAENGSVSWECYDRNSETSFWINRRRLADNMLNSFKVSSSV